MPIVPREPPGKAFDVVHGALSRRASQSARGLTAFAADPTALSIAMPHRVEFLAIDQLRGRTIPKSGKSACWRFLVLEERGGSYGAVAAATAVVAEKPARAKGRKPAAAARGRSAEPEEFDFGGLNEGPFVKGSERAIREAEALIESSGQDYEVVLLVVPAAYIVAVWLQSLADGAPRKHSSEADLLIPIEPVTPAFTPHEPITPSAFLDALRRGPKTVSA